MASLRRVCPLAFVLVCATTRVLAFCEAGYCCAPNLPPCAVDPVNKSTIRVEDCQANGFDALPDTNSWKAAIYCAQHVAAAPPYFGTIEATSGANYIIDDTLAIRSAQGGLIEGRGARLQWGGPADRPMFSLEDTQKLEIRDLTLTVAPGLGANQLHTAVRYTNPCDTNVVFPTENILNHVMIGGNISNKLDYGVVFDSNDNYNGTCQPGENLDEGNDQSTIMNSTIGTVMIAAIYINGQNSHQHRFYAVNATGADDIYGANTNARFVWNKYGSFSSIAGFRANFNGSEFYIENVSGSPILIVDSNSEGCTRFLETPTGNAYFPMPVHVIGGRFQVEQIAADGRVVSFHRMGPLTVEGLNVGGSNVSHPNPITIFFNPPDPAFSPGEAKFEVRGCYFGFQNSNTAANDPISLGTWGRLNYSSGNQCAAGLGSIVPCEGPLAAGLAAFGNASARTGILRVPNGKSLSGRNAANTGDVNLVNLNSSDQVELGDATHVTVVASNGTNGGLKVGAAGNTLTQIRAGVASVVSSGQINSQTHGNMATTATGLPAGAACSCSLGGTDIGTQTRFVYEYCYVNAGTLTLRLYNEGNNNSPTTGGPVDYLCVGK